MVSTEDVDLLKLLMEKTRRGSLEEGTLSSLADELGLSAGYLSRRLRQLADEGWVERHQRPTEKGRAVTYTPSPNLQVRWCSPTEGVVREWTCQGEVDWRFPLVSQVPDGLARATLVRFLERLRDERLLDPAYHRAREQDGEDLEFLHHGLTVFIHGSCARGEAPPGSDVDLVIVQKRVKDRSPGVQDGSFWNQGAQDAGVAPSVRDVAAEASLYAARPLQVNVVEEDQLVELPDPILEGLVRDGLVVYDGLRTGPGGRTLGAWEFLEGAWQHGE